VPTCLSVFLRKCVDPIHDLIVPNGCSTVWRRWFIFIWMLVEPALYRLENVFMLPSGDPSLLGGGEAVLDGAAASRFTRLLACES
jgi:hypothetical protein